MNSFDTETAITGTGDWELAAPEITGMNIRLKLILADAAGAGCAWSTSATPPGAGVPFSVAGTPGHHEFSEPLPRSAIFVKAPAGAVVTIISAQRRAV